MGIPITIINGGITAVSTVSSYSRIPIIPKVHITPIHTVQIEIKVALNDLKKKKKIREVTKIARRMKYPSSALMVSEYLVLT